ncbi:MAG: OmpA family protein [Proteobacteria bacterium]|nr:MAG: OmpA family protein [Pseudomonadota bacterium]
MQFEMSSFLPFASKLNIAIGGTSDSGTAGALRSIHFEYKKTAPLDGDLAQLKLNVEWLKNNPGVKLIVEGHGDRVGSNGYNSDLSRIRAENVRQLLIASGIDKARLKTSFMGRLVPVANPATASAYENSLDRRVNFIIESIH